jgi:hypothetical protein
MDAFLIFLFALPVAGLLIAMILVTRAPRDLSAHSHLDTLRHEIRPHR